jgi:hypothetical protein
MIDSIHAFIPRGPLLYNLMLYRASFAFYASTSPRSVQPAHIPTYRSQKDSPFSSGTVIHNPAAVQAEIVTIDKR